MYELLKYNFSCRRRRRVTYILLFVFVVTSSTSLFHVLYNKLLFAKTIEKIHNNIPRTPETHNDSKVHDSIIRHPSIYRDKLSNRPYLIWWTYYGGKEDENITCGDLECHVTIDREWRYFQGSKAYIFYGTSFDLFDLPLPRKDDDVWALRHEESPKNNDFLFSHEEIMTLFNYTSTFKRESDYPIPLQYLPDLKYLQSKEYFVTTEDKNRYRSEEKLAPILYIQSDCNVPSDRDSYFRLLKELVQVDSYGLCENNRKLPEYLSFAKDMNGMDHKDFFTLAAKYKFTLAMENAICDDYITEKVWRPLHLGSIPIVHSSPKIKDFLPNNASAILIDDFDNIHELVEYIQYLDQHDEVYDTYFNFKEEGGLTNHYLVDTVAQRDWNVYYSHFTSFECFLCRKINNLQKLKDMNIPRKATISKKEHYGCPKPKAFDQNGKYIVDKNKHEELWFHSKYLAKAFRNNFDGNMTFSETSIKEDIRILQSNDRK